MITCIELKFEMSHVGHDRLRDRALFSPGSGYNPVYNSPAGNFVNLILFNELLLLKKSGGVFSQVAANGR